MQAAPRPWLATVHRLDPRILHPSWKCTPAARGRQSGFPTGPVLSGFISAVAGVPWVHSISRPSADGAASADSGHERAESGRAHRTSPPESSSAPGRPAAGCTTGGASQRAPGSGARGPHRLCGPPRPRGLTGSSPVRGASSLGRVHCASPLQSDAIRGSAPAQLTPAAPTSPHALLGRADRHRPVGPPVARPL